MHVPQARNALQFHQLDSIAGGAWDSVPRAEPSAEGYGIHGFSSQISPDVVITAYLLPDAS
jgi:hypothetical protein